MKVSVITFPGSSSDRDVYDVFHGRGHEVSMIWHKDRDLQNPDLVILPGGASYGDYLRSGALASLSPIMDAVAAFAQNFGLVIGICNGFQVLTEAGLLPGTLMSNTGLSFICKHQLMRVESADSPFTKGLVPGSLLNVPIAHRVGNYFIDPEGLKALQDNDQILFRYSDAEGNIRPEANPNGSLDNIAGIVNTGRNVLGIMPHPERAATESVYYSEDGKQIFKALESFFDGGN